jgi:hypothetical protein
MTGSMLLTALALSDDSLLASLQASQVLQRVELALHSCKVLAVQDITWLSVWHAVNDLQQVLTVILPVKRVLVEPFSDDQVLHIWDDMGSRASILRRKLR